MRLADLGLPQYSKKELFNICHDIFGELKIKRMMAVNKGTPLC